MFDVKGCVFEVKGGVFDVKGCAFDVKLCVFDVKDCVFDVPTGIPKRVPVFNMLGRVFDLTYLKHERSCV